MRTILFPLVVLLVSLGVGAPYAQLLTGVSTGSKSKDPALERFARQFEVAFNKKDAAAVALLYVEDAVLMPPNVPLVRGRQAIQAFFTKEFEQGITDLRLTAIESSTSGQTGFDAGTSDVQIRAARPSQLTTLGVGGPSPAVRAQGKYVTIYKRVGPDWKIAFDIFNEDKATQ